MVVAGREAELVGSESLVGLCINTIPVRIAVPAHEPVQVWLRRLHEQLATLQRYSYYPLWQIQSLSELGAGQPLFQSILAFENYPIEQTLQQVQHSDLRLRFMDEEMPQRTNYPLSAVALPGEQIGLLLSYQEQALEAELVSRMLDLWQQVLQTLVQQPEQPLAALPLVSETERALLLDRWNATEQAYPQDVCVHELFAQQAQRQPQAIALVQGETSLTYGELDRRANQLAHYLRQLGVGPDVLVGLCVERSAEMVVGLFGILKAGGAYLPLEPGSPKERLAFMLQDAHPQLLLTQQRLLAQLPATAQPVVCLDSDWQRIAGQSEQKPLSGVRGENLAYVIYTSGSTGKPKGTMILHRGLLNYLSWCCQTYEASAGTGSPLHSPLGFDLSVTSLFSPLLTGQCITLVAEEQGAEALASALRTGADFSLVKLTPAHVQLLSQALRPQEAAVSTRALIIGGEALLAEQLAFWRQHAPSTRLINEYGPTETVVGCCVYEVAPQDAASGAVPIGRPIAHTQLYVLDAHMQVAPIEGPGELYLGGAGLARGYLKRPELTAERFIAHPFSQGPGARPYKTGDLARYRADGVLEFVGRLDHQVKLRGYRIELGEIEQALLEHPAVREGIVVVREDGLDNKQLVAYVVAVQDQEPVGEWQGLRRFLGERLPEYMVPSHFVLLEALPLTANGKVDRRALPAPEQVALHPGQQEDTAPRTSIEQTLTEIWSQVLHLPQVGIHDNFFALGGDSILSLSLIAQARRAGLQLTVKQLFQAPTIAQLSQLVTPLGAPAGSLLPQRASSQGTLALTPIQRWFFEQGLPNPHHWNQAFLLQAPTDLSVSLLEQAVQWVLGQHDVFRLRFVSPSQEADDWQASYLPVYEPVPFTLVDLRELPEEEQASRMSERCSQEQASLHLQNGPLARAVLFHLTGEQPWRLLLLSHHLVIDTVSWRILLEDLSQVYERLQQGLPLEPQATSSSFQQWAQRLQDYVHSEAIQRSE